MGRFNTFLGRSVTVRTKNFNWQFMPVYLFAFFLFAPSVNAIGITQDSSLPNVKVDPPIFKGLHVFMSQDAREASDVTLTMEKVPSPEIYLDWRDIDWKDPFARGGTNKVLPDSETLSQSGTLKIKTKTDTEMKLEMKAPSKMPSSTSIITSDSFDDLEDPFASKTAAPEMADPFEGYNRFMFDFNEGFYDNIMEPVVRGYRDVVNEDVRKAIGNIFGNAMAPLKLVSSFLQGDIEKTGRVIGRTIINTTIGLGGMFDIADRAFGIKDVNEDLDQVLGAYGIPTGPYVVLPFFGPSSMRGVVGRAGGMFLSPTYHFAPGIEVGGSLTVTEQVNDVSFHVEDIEQLEEATIDKYESVRDFYGQYRDRLINE